MSLRHPIARARGLGSAKTGVQHWNLQRLTAIALIGLVPWFVWFALQVIGADHAAVREFVARPLNASLLIAFALSLFWHARLGLQVVVEDYVHGATGKLLLVLVWLGSAFAMIATTYAILRVALAA
jgi:succinate dehydrogenase / fumarate reductase membrane anchor subunit